MSPDNAHLLKNMTPSNARVLAKLNQIDLEQRYRHLGKTQPGLAAPQEILELQAAINQAKELLRKGEPSHEALSFILERIRQLKAPRQDARANMIIVDFTQVITSLLNIKKSKPRW